MEIKNFIWPWNPRCDLPILWGADRSGTHPEAAIGTCTPGIRTVHMNGGGAQVLGRTPPLFCAPVMCLAHG